MTQTTKEIFEKYEIRKTKAQKTAFIDYIKSVCKQHNYDVKIEGKKEEIRNIVVGDPDKAEVLYTAHYDTCAKSPFPIINTPKSIGLYILVQILTILPILLIASCVALGFGFLSSRITLDPILSFTISYVGFLALISLYFLWILGPTNKHTANDNTSGVTTLLDIMTTLPNELRDKVCFVFFDLEEVGMIGSSNFAKLHKDTIKDKLVLNFDCVSDGDTMFFGIKKTAHKYTDLIEKSFVSNDKFTVDIAKKNFIYTSDNMAFKGGVGVASLNKTKRGILYMNKIHTKKDTVYNEENIEFLVDGAIKLLKAL